MEPGRASSTQPPFPESWSGLWQDPSGKVMYIEQVGLRQLLVSFAAGVQQPFYPLVTSPLGLTRRLPAVYLVDHYGVPALQVDIGNPLGGTRYDIHFVFGEGDRLRTAESWDMVSGIMARPQLAMGWRASDGPEPECAWAYPLSNYWKMEEEEARFKAFHGW